MSLADTLIDVKKFFSQLETCSLLRKVNKKYKQYQFTNHKMNH